MNTEHKPSTFAASRSLRNRALAGTALGLLLAGALAAGDSMLGNHSAFAAGVPETQVNTAQVPDFADLVQKVSPAVVSIRVREAASSNAGASEDSDNHSQS